MPEPLARIANGKKGIKKKAAVLGTYQKVKMEKAAMEKGADIGVLEREREEREGRKTLFLLPPYLIVERFENGDFSSLRLRLAGI